MYFDQQTHACAYVRIVENDKKHFKIIKYYHDHVDRPNFPKVILFTEGSPEVQIKIAFYEICL